MPTADEYVCVRCGGVIDVASRATHNRFHAALNRAQAAIRVLIEAHFDVTTHNAYDVAERTLLTDQTPDDSVGDLLTDIKAHGRPRPNRVPDPHA